MDKPRIARRRRSLLTLFLVAAAVVLSSCLPWTGGPEPVLSSLVVRNRSFFDVNVYLVRSPLARPIRLGMVVGAGTERFPLRASDLQPGGWLVVDVHPLGTRYTWRSDPVSVDSATTAVLDVNADAFGDCSSSSLYTVATTDTPRESARR